MKKRIVILVTDVGATPPDHRQRCEVDQEFKVTVRVRSGDDSRVFHKMLVDQPRLEIGPIEPEPIPMRLPCPEKDCGRLHIDEGEFATRSHHTHACQHCGSVWRPAVVATVGVRFLPGFKNEVP